MQHHKSLNKFLNLKVFICYISTLHNFCDHMSSLHWAKLLPSLASRYHTESLLSKRIPHLWDMKFPSTEGYSLIDKLCTSVPGGVTRDHKTVCTVCGKKPEIGDISNKPSEICNAMPWLEQVKSGKNEQCITFIIQECRVLQVLLYKVLRKKVRLTTPVHTTPHSSEYGILKTVVGRTNAQLGSAKNIPFHIQLLESTHIRDSTADFYWEGL